MQKLAKSSPTVDALRKQGAVQLNDAQLKALIVDKSPWLQNNVTDSKFKIIFSALGSTNATQTLTPIDPNYTVTKLPSNQGETQIAHVGRNSIEPSAVGDLASRSYVGTITPYYITNGKIITSLAGTQMEVTAYKLGDKYYGARSNELGYANYEIIPEIAELNPLGLGKVQLH